jgi:TonB family protein
MRYGVGWLLLCVVTNLGLAQAVSRGTTSEQVLRAHAIKIVRPSFPPEARLHRQTGVAVAEVQLDPAGRVSQVQILEAPALAIAQSVSEAVAQWQFTPFNSQSGGPMILSAKLTFYFEIKAGKAMVLEPVDAGYVGRWPESSTKRVNKKKDGASANSS